MKRLFHKLSILLGLTISLVALFFAIQSIDWAQTLQTIRKLNIPYVIVALCFLIAGIFLRAERWHIITAKQFIRLPFYKGTALGFFFNYIYPARAGDILKIVSLHRSTGLSLKRVGLSAIVDRIMDVLILIFLTWLSLMFIPNLEVGGRFLNMAAASLILGIVLGLSPVGEKFLHIMDRRLIYESEEQRWKYGLKKVVQVLLLFRKEITHKSRLLALISLLLMVALLDYCSIYFLLKAFSWQLPLITPVVVWVFISLGTALPSAPAGIGIHQLACIMSLKIFTVSQSDAFAFSLIFQAIAFVSVLMTILLVVICPSVFYKRSRKC
jgi:uncharacterized protein (TIRG00374 family)